MRRSRLDMFRISPYTIAFHLRIVFPGQGNYSAANMALDAHARCWKVRFLVVFGGIEMGLSLWDLTKSDMVTLAT